MTECQERAEKYPSDLLIRFELGQLYFQAGKISEAIQELQKAQNNPNRRIQALTCLGQCFARRNMNDLAAKTLEKALAEKVVFDDEKMEIIYALGGVLEKMGKTEEAIEQFKQIYEVDAAFKDVGRQGGRLLRRAMSRVPARAHFPPPLFGGPDDVSGELGAEMRGDARFEPRGLAGVVALQHLRHFMQARDDGGIAVRHAQFHKFADGPQLRAQFLDQAAPCPRRFWRKRPTRWGY